MIFDVTAGDRALLEAIIAAPTSAQKHVSWEKIILMSGGGLGTVAITEATGKSKPCVWRLQERFMSEVVDGLLRDRSRPPGIAQLDGELVERVVAVTLETPRQEATHWTVRAMAKPVGMQPLRSSRSGIIPNAIYQKPCAHRRRPMDMIFHGRSCMALQA